MDAGVSEKDMNNLIEQAVHFKQEALVQYYNAMINRPDRLQVLKMLLFPYFLLLVCTISCAFQRYNAANSFTGKELYPYFTKYCTHGHAGRNRKNQ